MIFTLLRKRNTFFLVLNQENPLQNTQHKEHKVSTQRKEKKRSINHKDKINEKLGSKEARIQTPT